MTARQAVRSVDVAAALRSRLDTDASRIVDVRTPAEFETAHIPGSCISVTDAANEGSRAHGGVVVHLDEREPAKHEAVLRNISHLTAELGASTPVELVTHGPGLAITLSSSPHAEQVRSLLGRGVTVTACANTMRRDNITQDDLILGVQVVPAGIVHIVQRERQGWAYVRP
jgi:intracellular sulfur oxidation DsrE/DsrF family protein